MTVITNNQAPVPESHDGYGNGPSKRAVDANGNPNVGLPWHGAGLPHVEDIASAPTDIDANQSIKRLLDQSQTLMGQADMFRELGRIDFALREYIKSYTIAFQTVPNHDEYTSLPNDRPELYKRHRALKAQLDTHFNTYMQIKEQIRADNLRTGVKPTRVHHVRTQTSSHTRSGSNVSVNNPAPGAARQSLDQYVGADARPKPPVQPKPQSLHGRALQNGHVKSSSVSSAGDSLTARFKNLGGPTTSPGQDPRIRTHPIAAPKPAGPREMPSAAKPALGVDTTSPFPARPAAIYVPTRPNMTAEAAQLPSSATRTHPSRSGSYASHPGTPNGTVKPPSNDYFTPPSRSNTGLSNGRVSLSENRNEIQSGETISPSELKTLMNKYSILIIDTRARSEFDEGHIMSTSIICVEPDILSRGDIGAADIADSLILSPSHEQEIFNKRNEYDLIVYYNQMSKSLQSPPSSLEEQVIVSLHRALTLLNDPPLKRNPKLLKGGLDAWIDFLGPACLQATVASDADRPKLLPPGPRSRRRSSYVPIELPQQDIEGFQEDINREYYRTQDDFVKRYPAVPVKQESMVLSSPQQVPQRPFARPPAPTESIPKPLQAPEPAKARASHTYHGSHDGSHDGGSNMRGTGAGTIPGAIGTKMTWRTGLDNPHNWCYANSVIQSLLVSNFGSELAEATQWKRRYIVPRKQGEKTAPPQLMIQMLSNLFYWMENKSFKVMKADTLLRYARHVREQQKRRERTPDFALFGDTNQQDAHEFQEWLWSELDNETNTRRNVNEPTGEALWPKVTQRHELQGAADRFFTEYMKYHDSIYDMYRTFVTVTESRCPSCSKQNWAWEASHHLFVPSDRDATLAQCLDQAANVQSDFTCDHCKTLNKKVNIRYRYQRLPRMLCIQFSRFDARPGPNGYSYYKLAHRIEWDLDNFDMSPWLIDGPNKEDARYECIAVIQHTGQSMHSGHYTAHTRKGTNWWLCNDHKVSRLSPGEVRKEIFDQNDRSVPYLVWFQKKV